MRTLSLTRPNIRQTRCKLKNKFKTNIVFEPEILGIGPWTRARAGRAHTKAARDLKVKINKKTEKISTKMYTPRSSKGVLKRT